MSTARPSRAEWIASLPDSERRAFLRSLTDEEATAALYTWSFWARPNQLPPAGLWFIWLLLTGRGFGKTRAGAEWVRHRVECGEAKSIALIAKTPAEARDVMIEGKPGAPGLVDLFPPWQRPTYEPSKRRVTFYNGAVATAYSGAEPDQLRGGNFDTAWADEPAAWQYPSETWGNLALAVRLGDPRICATTTPRPIKLIRELVERARNKRGVILTTGSTYENRANLPESFYEEVVGRYEGTSLAEQEIHGRVLDEMPGALLTRAIVEACRLAVAPPLRRIVVAIDPAVTVSENSSETGIIVAGVADNGHGYVLRDLSGRLSPDSWASRAVGAYSDLQADRIVGEQNNGGDMVRNTILTVNDRVCYKAVTASKGKHTRAEPVAALYEQGKVHHVGGFPELEDQWCTWVPGEDSPDRLDACVWALSELMLNAPAPIVAPISLTKVSLWRGR